MITREQWDTLTDQQKWDQYCLLESMVDPDGDDSDDTTPIPFEEIPERLVYTGGIPMHGQRVIVADADRVNRGSGVMGFYENRSISIR